MRDSRKEAILLSRMKHPNIVAFREAFESNNLHFHSFKVFWIWVAELKTWLFFSDWPPVYCYGVLQWRRSSPEDSATESDQLLHWKCKSWTHTKKVPICAPIITTENFPDIEMVCSDVCRCPAHPWQEGPAQRLKVQGTVLWVWQ